MMLVLDLRDGEDLFFGDGDLGTAGRGEDFGNVVDVEVGAEGFLHFSLLGLVPGFFGYFCGIY